MSRLGIGNIDFFLMALLVPSDGSNHAADTPVTRNLVFCSQYVPSDGCCTLSVPHPSEGRECEQNKTKLRVLALCAFALSVPSHFLCLGRVTYPKAQRVRTGHLSEGTESANRTRQHRV